MRTSSKPLYFPPAAAHTHPHTPTHARVRAHSLFKEQSLVLTCLSPQLTCLEIGLEDIWRKSDGPVEDSGQSSCQEDVGGAELGDAGTRRWLLSRCCDLRSAQASLGCSPLTLRCEGVFEVLIREEV